jgi:hypothetical protein
MLSLAEEGSACWNGDEQVQQAEMLQEPTYRDLSCQTTNEGEQEGLEADLTGISQCGGQEKHDNQGTGEAPHLYPSSWPDERMLLASPRLALPHVRSLTASRSLSTIIPTRESHSMGLHHHQDGGEVG